MSSEKQPLLKKSNEDLSEKGASGSLDSIKLKKHITLPYGVAILMGSVIGSGIFISPTGVTANIGSVGGSLIIWSVTGVLSLCQAMCYAELGTMIPKAGGDYTYIHDILGPLPGFMALWINVLIISTSSSAVISRTAALYLIQPLGLSCRLDIITLIAVFIIVFLAVVNCVSVLWSARMHTVFYVSKIAALCAIIIMGIVKLAQGYTENFENAMEGTVVDPGAMSLAILNGYFAYKGWENFNALREEMVNPERDIPLVAGISMIGVTFIYVLVNVAYFSVLTPAEMISSEAVALVFAERALGPIAPVIPIAVALSCMGSVNGEFLSNSRYIFAGGRNEQIPQVFAFIHGRFYTPFFAVIGLTIFNVIYASITNVEQLLEYASFTILIKIVMVFVVLLYLRWKAPDVPRPMKVNIVIVVLTLISVLLVIGFSLYQNPLTSVVAIGIFCLGLPLYGLSVLMRRRKMPNVIMDKITEVLQLLLFIIPERETPKPVVKKYTE